MTEVEKPPSRHFIIDCSGFTFVDYMGINGLKEVYDDMRKMGVLVYFAAAKGDKLFKILLLAPVRDMFAQCGFFETVSKANFYPTIRDAVAIARFRQRQRGEYDSHQSLAHLEEHHDANNI